jgi:DNA-binding response OmpR family regulator
MQVQPLHPPRILVVEHDQGIAELLSTFLEREEYEPQLAPSLEIALERIDEQVFHLVLTDLFVERPRYPFRRVRRLLQYCPPTPAGLMTGWQVSPEEARRQGFDFLLQKPFDLDLALAQIATSLSQSLTSEQEVQAELAGHFFEALEARNQEALERLLMDDITYYLPSHLAFPPGGKVRGRAAYLAYLLEAFNRYRDPAFDEVLLYPRPRGIAARYCLHWRATDGTRQQMAGATLFHFQGDRIRQIGIRLNNQRLRVLQEKQQGQPGP